MIDKITKWYHKQSPTTKGFIWIGIILIIGIILRWDYVIDNVLRSFKFLNK